MNWNFTLGLIASVALFVPILLIILLRLTFYRSFPALFIYYIVVFGQNFLGLGIIPFNKNIIHYWGITNNMLDASLMILFLSYFSTTLRFTNQMRILVAALLVFNGVVIFANGYTVKAITIIMAPGLLAVFAFCLYFFIRQTKITIMHGKATGKALIVSALLFAYGCYSIIYLMYYVLKTEHKGDVYIIYFMVTIFSSFLMCAGLFVEKKRIQKLAELKITRKELSLLYQNDTVANRMSASLLAPESLN
jgi:hypothetical protein